jgi:hypothetical protein
MKDWSLEAQGIHYLAKVANSGNRHFSSSPDNGPGFDLPGVWAGRKPCYLSILDLTSL